MADASQGAQSKLIVEPLASPHVFDGASERYDFLYETLQKRGRIVGARGITGSRSQLSERTRFGPYSVGGQLAMYTCSADLDLWLPRILGGAESLDSFPLDETLPAFGVLVDREADVFEYKDCYINRAVFRSRAAPSDEENELWEMVLDIVGKDESTATTWPATEPALSVAANRSPYLLSDAVVTLNGASREVMDLAMVVDNFLDVRHTNSLTPTSITPQDRLIRILATLPFNSTTLNLYGQALAGSTGSVAITLGGTSTTFTFGTIQSPDISPVVMGKREIVLKLEMVARQLSTTKELVVTNDSVA